jgi:hypothetical protein
MSHPLGVAAAVPGTTRPIAGWIFAVSSARTPRTRAALIRMRLYKKGAGQTAKLCYVGHAVMENRHGLLVDFLITTASGTAECAVVPDLMDALRERRFHPRTVGLDKGC